MPKTVQELAKEGQNGCCILPGSYHIDRPIQIPAPAHGIYQFECLPGAIFSLAPDTALFDLSLLSPGDFLECGTLFLLPSAGCCFARENSSQAYVRALFASAPAGLDMTAFLGGAKAGRMACKIAT